MANELRDLSEVKLIRAKRIRTLIISIISVIVIAAICYYMFVVKPANTYEQAVALMESGDLSGALNLFSTIKGHKDSDDRIAELEAVLERTNLVSFNADSLNAVGDKYSRILSGNSSVFSFRVYEVNEAGYNYYRPDDESIMLIASGKLDGSAIVVYGSFSNNHWTANEVVIETFDLGKSDVDNITKLYSTVLYSVFGVEESSVQREVYNELSTWSLEYFDEDDSASFEFGNVGCNMYTWEGDGIGFLDFGAVPRSTDDPRFES